MLVCFLCTSDLVISASCLASRLICFCFTSCTFLLRKLQHLVRHLLFFASGRGGSFTYMGFLLKCTLSVLQSQRSGFGISCGNGLSVLQSQALLFQNARFWETVFDIIFPLWTCLFLLKVALPPRFALVATRPKSPKTKIRPCRRTLRHIYIYIYACCKVKNWSNFCPF